MPAETSPSVLRFLRLPVLLGAQLAIGSSAILARFALQNGVSPLSLAAWRLLIAFGIVLIPLLFARRAERFEAMTGRERFFLILAGICLAFHFWAWFASLEAISVARSTLLVTTSPIWSGLAGALFLKQRMGFRFWGGLTLACAGGVGVTLFGAPVPGRTPGAGEWVGDVLALGGALAIAAYFLLVDGVQKRHGTVRTIAGTYGVAALWLWLSVLFSGGRSSVLPVSGLGWAMVIGMALIPQLIGHTSLNWSLLHFPIAVVSVSMLLEPLFAGILALLLLHEPITPGQILSALLLLTGVATVIVQGGRGR